MHNYYTAVSKKETEKEVNLPEINAVTAKI